MRVPLDIPTSPMPAHSLWVSRNNHVWYEVYRTHDLAFLHQIIVNLAVPKDCYWQHYHGTILLEERTGPFKKEMMCKEALERLVPGLRYRIAFWYKQHLPYIDVEAITKAIQETFEIQTAPFRKTDK